MMPPKVFIEMLIQAQWITELINLYFISGERYCNSKTFSYGLQLHFIIEISIDPFL